MGRTWADIREMGFVRVLGCGTGNVISSDLGSIGFFFSFF